MRTILIFTMIAFWGFSCKSGESLTSEETASQMKEKIESGNYTFIPQAALPMGGKSIQLDYSYSVKVSKDTVESYLPYFGRAYTAPMPSSDGGIKFISEDFYYTVSVKKKEMWDVVIVTKDVQPKYTLIFSIGASGYANLTVNENNRQPISFYGKIE